MQIVIDIPYGTYDAIQQGLTNQVITNKLWNSVKIGVPLPKNHGRLIDADALNFNANYYEPLIHKQDIDNTPTVIEAESEDKE